MKIKTLYVSTTENGIITLTVGQCFEGHLISDIYLVINQYENFGYRIELEGTEPDFIPLCCHPVLIVERESQTYKPSQPEDINHLPVNEVGFYESYKRISIPSIEKVYEIGMNINGMTIASIRKFICDYGMESYECLTESGNSIVSIEKTDTSLLEFIEGDLIDSYRSHELYDYSYFVMPFPSNFNFIDQVDHNKIIKQQDEMNKIAEYPVYPESDLPDEEFYRERDKRISTFLELSFRQFMFSNHGRRALFINDLNHIFYGTIRAFTKNKTPGQQITFFKGDYEKLYYKIDIFYSSPSLNSHLTNPDNLHVKQVFILNSSSNRCWDVRDQISEFHRLCRQNKYNNFG